MKILKFGGSSLKNPERVRHVAQLVARLHASNRAVVVVSAFGGTTDDLVGAAQAAVRGAGGEEGHVVRWQAIADRHHEAAVALATIGDLETLRDAIDALMAELRELLRGAELLRECSPRTLDSILSYGERLSSLVIAAALRAAGTEARAVDARTLIVTDETFGRAIVDRGASHDQIRAHLLARSSGGVAVVTGFVGASREGYTTTLGRGGSDYTAALLGAALDAEAIELWTDVSGVLSADPRQVPEAFPQAHMGYAELMELSHFGAKVVYPPTVHPARESGIPLVIKNTLDPKAKGTVITERAPAAVRLVRGVTSIPHVALMRLEGDGMVGVPGIASRLFGALANRGVSVILISQASSEHSICFAVAPDDASEARTAVDEAFALERQAGLVRALVVETDLAVVAAVGEALRERPGVAGTVFGALGRQGINVRAIAQGSSERNISLVVARRDETRAVRALHRAFFPVGTSAPTSCRQLRLAICGVGRVGSALLEQLRTAASALRETEGIELSVAAIMNSRNLIGAGSVTTGIDLGNWRARLDEAGEQPSRGTVTANLSNPDEGARPPAVFVDCTASDAVADWYPELLAAGIHVVAANKRAFSGSISDWRRLQASAQTGDVALRFEATVGAGLPVLGPLQDLVRSGDTVHRIDGLLSGTLGAVLDDLNSGTRFSEAVRKAYDAGFTEPHPWDDLSGADVGRKLCILARRAGHLIEPEDVRVAPLLEGEGWEGISLEAFWQRLPSVDDAFEAQRAAAAAAGQRLRYIASFDPAAGGARVTVAAVDPAHPAFAVTGPDNLIVFTTERYCDTPLVIRGPGAGPAVTAAGVFSDVLAIVR